MEIYAQACEKFLLLGGKEILKFTPTWSWWGFFGNWAFFLYRKRYIVAVIAFLLCLLCYVPYLSILILICFGVYAKFEVCRGFVETLNLQNDEILKMQGGVNKLVIPVVIILNIIAITAFIIIG